MPSSQTNRTDPSSLGWPINEKQEVPGPTTLPQFEAALCAAGSPSIVIRACKESSQSPDPFCVWFAYEDLSDKYAPNDWGPPPESPTPPFSIQPVSGYGKGMVASRAIKTGETILFERPVIIYPAIIGGGLAERYGPWGALEYLCEAGFPVLGEKERSLYVDLWNCKPLSGTLGNKICGIARTNGMFTGFTRSKHLPRYAGVFPNISRCNHSCGPNASARFDEETMAMRLFSRRPIAPGEQITLSYVVGTMSCARRQEELKTKYLFTCECDYCKPTKPSRPSRPLKHLYWNIVHQPTNNKFDLQAEIFASDIRRSQLAFRLEHAETLWVEWLSPSSKQSDKDLIQFHEDALVVIAQEGLHLMRITHVAYLAHACAALEDNGGFRRWGNMLISLSEWTEGHEGGEQKKTWQDWVRDPMASPAWGLRVQAKKAKAKPQGIARA